MREQKGNARKDWGEADNHEKGREFGGQMAGRESECRGLGKIVGATDT